MALRILCLGKTEKGLYTQLLQEYLPRLGKYTVCNWEENQTIKHKGNLEQTLNKEADWILKFVKPQDYLCLLDEKGSEFTSRKLAKWIDETTKNRSGDLIFVIGSAYGFSEKLYQRCNGKISLSKLTFNHQMVRGILAEQLYRAYNILNGGTYHND